MTVLFTKMRRCLAFVANELVLAERSSDHKKIAVDFVVVVQFRSDKLACERIYWDHAAALRQAGLLRE